MKLTSKPIYLDYSDVCKLKNLLQDIIINYADENTILVMHQSSFADHIYISIRKDGLNIDREEMI